MRNTETFCVRSKVSFLVPFGCHIFNELTYVIQFTFLFFLKEVGTRGSTAATTEKHTGSWGHRSPWKANSSQGLWGSKYIQAARGYASWQTERQCVCLLTVALFHRCSMTLSCVQLQHGLSVSLEYPESRSHRVKGRGKQMLTLGVPWRKASRVLHSSPEKRAHPCVHSGFSAHMDNGSISQGSALPL